MHLWVWIALGALTVLVIVEQLRIFKANREFHKKDEIFQAVTENAADMIALVDVKGRRLYNSPAYKRVLGYSPAELSDTSSFEQIHPDDRMRVLEAAREARESGVSKRLEYRIKHKDGSWRVLESVASTIRDAKGEVAKLVIVNRDITERKRAEQQLEYNLFHDLLTGLPNRRMFIDRLQTAFARMRRETGRSYALLLANVDHFKVFNEAMGTKAGDHILTEIARRLLAEMRRDDAAARDRTAASDASLFRLGADEFTILLETVGDPSDALRIARRLQEAVAAPFPIESREVRASASVGIALTTPAHTRPEEKIASADPELTVTVLSHLKHFGIGTVLDNFGTGSTSLVGLTQFPVDALKIDRSLIREMQTDRSASDMVELIILLAHKMNLKVIAEGIETVRQLERLLELGCEYGQGYFFSQPMEAKAALIFMRQQLASRKSAGTS